MEYARREELRKQNLERVLHIMGLSNVSESNIVFLIRENLTQAKDTPRIGAAVENVRFLLLMNFLN